MSPFGNGHPKDRPERRHAMRRDDDVDPTTERGFQFWARVMLVHRGKFYFVFGLLGAIAGFVTTGAILSPRVTRLEQAVAAVTLRTERLERSDELKTYILCVMVRKTDPVAVPGECAPILESRGIPR